MAGQAGTTGQGLKNSPHDDPDRGNEGKSQLDMKRQNWQARSLSTLQLVAFYINNLFSVSTASVVSASVCCASEKRITFDNKRHGQAIIRTAIPQTVHFAHFVRAPGVGLKKVPQMTGPKSQEGQGISWLFSSVCRAHSPALG